MNDLKRCGWCGSDPLYVAYHDEEWGKPVIDDRILFEFLILEAAQAGLSWITILKKRAGYRKNFAGFDASEVVQFGEKEVEEILKDPGIIRNRAKVLAAIGSARIFLNLQKEFGSFYHYLYSFMPSNKPAYRSVENYRKIPTTSPESDALSKDLKKRGMKFFGSTICYAFMQAVGMVNDHENDCSFKGIRSH